MPEAVPIKFERWEGLDFVNPPHRINDLALSRLINVDISLNGELVPRAPLAAILFTSTGFDTYIKPLGGIYGYALDDTDDTKVVDYFGNTLFTIADTTDVPLLGFTPFYFGFIFTVKDPPSVVDHYYWDGSTLNGPLNASAGGGTSIGTIYKDRAFYFSNKRLFYSKVGAPLNVASSADWDMFIDLPSSIKSVCVYGGLLFIFTETGIFTLNATQEPTLWSLNKKSSLVAEQAVELDNILYILSLPGRLLGDTKTFDLYQSDGTVYSKIIDNQQRRPLSSDNPDYSLAQIFTNTLPVMGVIEGRLAISLRDGKCLMYDPNLQYFTVYEHEEDLVPVPYGNRFSSYSTAGGTDTTWPITSGRGYSYSGDESLFVGSPSFLLNDSFIIQTKLMNFGFSKPKTIRDGIIEIYYNNASGSGSKDVTFTTDYRTLGSSGGSSVSPTLSSRPFPRVHRYITRGTGLYWQLEITGDLDDEEDHVRIGQLELDVEVMDNHLTDG